MNSELAPGGGNGTSNTSADLAGRASVVSALTVLLRNRRWFAIPFLVVSVAVFTLGYPRKLAYTSVASFMAEAQRTSTNASSVAAQLGITANQASTSSPMFYPELLKSPQFMESVVDSRYRDPAAAPRDTSTKTLVDIFNVQSPDPRMGRDLAVKTLGQLLSVSVNPQTGIVNIAITSDRPYLSQEIAQSILRNVQDFHIRTRQGRATAERQFVESRLHAVRDDLQIAEDTLRTFLQANHPESFDHSPLLQFTRARYERDVSVQAQLYSTLTQSYEQAKLDEVRDTPVITILSPPELPVFPNPRGRFRLLLLSIFAGLGVAVIAVFLADQLRGGKDSGSEHEELSKLLDDMRSDLWHGRLIRVAFGRAAKAPLN